MKRIIKVLLVIGMVITSLVFLIQCKPSQTFPNSGIWYCEDLQIQVCFDKKQDKYDTYIIIDEEKTNCSLSTDYGNRFFSIVYQDTTIVEYNYDTSFFAGEFISFDDTTLVVLDSSAGKEYIFTRVDSP